ncbi:MAG: hypothetical protein LBR07_02595 [Puniceicoccales bacterium]|nr:hypothetical protein [Puniceicoccales bacterium]
MPFWVSDLALVFANRHGARRGLLGGETETAAGGGFVTRAGSGEPVAGAKVAVWRRERDSVERVKVAETVTGADGAFALKRGIGWGTDVLHVTAPDGQQLSSDRAHPGHVAGAPPPDRTRYHAHFLTDRAIYRPGQTIHFKVVVFTANRDTSEYRPAAGRRLTVGLLDPNGKDAATLSLTTNGFGAAHGTFTVPAGRLTGYYQLHSLGAENGRAGLRVEEYKRPKFEVALNAPVAAPKLGGSVTLAGSARQYTGAAVDTARVRWTVRRLTRWPDWCWWRPAGAGAGTARQIARGETRTAADGSFLVTFNAAPDKTADPKTEPRFHYEVSAEVTDAAGETRAVSRTVVAGYAAVAAEVTAGGWQSPAAPVAFTVRTFSLDGEPRPLAGNLVIYSLKQPERALRKPLGSEDAYDYGGGDADPDAPTGGEPRHWAELDGVASQRFTTNEKGVATLALKLDAGVYRAVVTARDAAGAPVTARAEVTVADPAAAQSVSREPFALEVRRDTLRPGDTFAAVWRSGHETARARVEIVHRGKTLAAFWTEPGRTQQLVTLPVTDALRGGFSVRVWQVAENRFYESARAIRVPWDDKRLDIAWERFNSKLTPGGRETWTLRVRNPDGSPAAAEIAAALYDASLDAFAGANTWRAIGDTGIFYDESRLWFGRLAFANGIQSGRRLYDKHPNATADSFSKQTYPACYRHWAAEIAGTWESWRPKWEMRDRRVNMVSAFDSRSVSAPRAAAPAFARVKESAVAAAGAADAQIATSQLQSSPDATGGAGAAAAGAVVALDQISARQNLRETAFFFPALIAEPDGGARLEFTAPEALTRWRFLAFAHDRQLRSGAFADASIVTAKDFMVQPDAPRFIREGDTLEIAVRLTNKGDAPLAGRVRLNFADAATLDPADAALGNTAPEREFTLPARSSRALSWRVRVPDGRGWLTYKAVGAAGLLSDGEEGFLPVLPRRQLVTDTLTFAVPSAAAETGTAGSAAVLRPVTRDFAPLLESADPARQIRHEALTVSVVSNPAWYAVMALPVLMEPGRREWSDELFHRLYANSLAARIAGADPRIERVFAQWRNTPALDSPLAKNTDLKSVLLEETPWVRDAEGESASRRRVGILFDKSRIAAEVAAALNDLMQRQRPDGFWPWCPGGDLSEHTTRRIVAGFGKLRAAAGERNAAIPRFLQRAIAALDAALVRSHLTALAAAKQRGADASREDHIGPAEAFHLYARSFFPPSGGTGGGTSAEVRAALDFYREQARVYWPTLPLLSQCHVALALHRTGTTAGQREAAAGIVRSLRERARLDPEQGMWWPPAAREGWLWRNAPLETQAAAIEVFNEVAADAPAVAALQRWLISQKQVRAWSTASATADAVYALLLPPPAGARVSDPIQERGSPTRPANAATGAAFPLLAAGTLPTVTLGGAAITPRNVEAGTGYYSERIAGALVKPTLGHISVTRPDAGVSWASVAWQYFQPLGQIRAAAATPLTIRKTLWKRVRTATGDTLVPVTGTAAAGANSAAATTTAKTGAPAGNAPLALGDTLVVRVEIRADRDMEFIHLKDQRPSGCEPVNVLSGHHYRSGLGYYESVRDTASHFFIAHLPAGTHVFEYDMRVRNRGLFQSGVAEIQSAYAPAFASRSASTPLRVE